MTIHKTYLPLVSNQRPPPVVGYAWSCLSEADTSRLGMTWFHRWQPEAGSRRCNGSEFVQHVSCETRPYKAPYWQYQYDELEKYVEAMGDVSFPLIFLNEPDLSGQCYRTPQEAIGMYEAIIAIAPNARIIGPQVSHLDYLAGWVWLKEWYSLLATSDLPQPAFGAIHNYDQEPMAQLDSYSQIPGAPTKVWVTEFGTKHPEVLRRMLQVYSADERIERYAYYAPVGDTDGYPLIIDEQLTELGRTWVSFHS